MPTRTSTASSPPARRPTACESRGNIADDPDSGAHGIAGEIGQRQVFDLDGLEGCGVSAALDRPGFGNPVGLPAGAHRAPGR